MMVSQACMLRCEWHLKLSTLQVNWRKLLDVSHAAQEMLSCAVFEAHPGGLEVWRRRSHVTWEQFLGSRPACAANLWVAMSVAVWAKPDSQRMYLCTCVCMYVYVCFK